MIRLESKAKRESTHKYKSLLLTGFAVDRPRFVVVSYRFGQNHQLERIRNVEQTENTPHEGNEHPHEGIVQGCHIPHEGIVQGVPRELFRG